MAGKRTIDVGQVQRQRIARAAERTSHQKYWACVLLLSGRIKSTLRGTIRAPVARRPSSTNDANDASMSDAGGTANACNHSTVTVQSRSQHLLRERQHHRLEKQREATELGCSTGLDECHAAVGQLHAWRTHFEGAVVLEEVQVPVALDDGVMHRLRAATFGWGKWLPAVKSIWIVSCLAAVSKSTPVTNHGSLTPNAASNSWLCMTSLCLVIRKTGRYRLFGVQQRHISSTRQLLPTGRLRRRNAFSTIGNSFMAQRCAVE